MWRSNVIWLSVILTLDLLHFAYTQSKKKHSDMIQSNQKVNDFSQFHYKFIVPGCQTIGGPSGKGKACIFPFTHSGKTHNGCAPEGKDK